MTWHSSRRMLVNSYQIYDWRPSVHDLHFPCPCSSPSALSGELPFTASRHCSTLTCMPEKLPISKAVIMNTARTTAPPLLPSHPLDTEGEGCMRQENNTLSAEIRLTADASIVRKINGQVLTDQQVTPASVGIFQRQ